MRGGGALGKKVAGSHLVEPSVSSPDDLDGSVWPLAVNLKGSQASSWDAGPKRWGGVVGDCEVTLRLPHGVRVERTLASPHGHCLPGLRHGLLPGLSTSTSIKLLLKQRSAYVVPFLRNPPSVAPCSL